jgi:hypothetical protein
MELKKPLGVPDELWARVLTHQDEAREFEERKQRLLSSFKAGDVKMLDRVTQQLQVDQEKLKARQDSLCVELREYGVDI